MPSVQVSRLGRAALRSPGWRSSHRSAQREDAATPARGTRRAQVTPQSAIRTAVAKVDRDQPISFFQTLESTLAQSLGAQRIVASLTAAFAVIALLLAAVGLYSVVPYAVGQRTSEIGIRMALGARPGQVLGLIMGSGLRLVAAGLLLGLSGAAGTAQLIRTLLSNVHPLDPWVYGSAAVCFVGVSALACLVPSVRAARLDPLAALADRRPTRRR
jgi:ABC-type antimicrobial peptide transport system permease subunit